MSITDLKDRWQQTVEHACHLRHLAREVRTTGREEWADDLQEKANKAFHRADVLFSQIINYEPKVENEDDT